MTSDSKSNKDCCLCLKKKVQKTCQDSGCMEMGGMCVDMKNTYLKKNQFPRNVVDVSKPIGGFFGGDRLCVNPNGPEKKMCCQCYQRKGLPFMQ